MILGNTVMARRMWGNTQAVSLKKITPNKVPKLVNSWRHEQGKSSMQTSLWLLLQHGAKHFTSEDAHLRRVEMEALVVFTSKD